MKQDLLGVKAHHFSNKNEIPNILRVKCALSGDSGVGKTALLEVLNRDKSRFPEHYSMTLGINIVVKSVTLEDTPDQVEMYIYDSSGKDSYGEMIQKLWNNLCMIIIVFDLTSETSFNNCVMWLEKAKFLNKGINLSGLLIGNKSDLDVRRKVHKNAAANFAQKNGLLYYECSAKDATNVNDAFRHLAQEWHKLYDKKSSAYNLLT